MDRDIDVACARFAGQLFPSIREFTNEQGIPRLFCAQHTVAYCADCGARITRRNIARNFVRGEGVYCWCALASRQYYLATYILCSSCYKKNDASPFPREDYTMREMMKHIIEQHDSRDEIYIYGIVCAYLATRKFIFRAMCCEYDALSLDRAELAGTSEYHARIYHILEIAHKFWKDETRIDTSVCPIFEELIDIRAIPDMREICGEMNDAILCAIAKNNAVRDFISREYCDIVPLEFMRTVGDYAWGMRFARV